jgi:hypothetical protein
MSNAIRQSLCAISISLMMFLIPITAIPVFADGTTILIAPEVTTLSYVPQTFTINVNISQVNDLAGWDFKLYYPDSILNATNIVEGPFLQTAGGTTFQKVGFTDHYNATHGRIWAACTLFGQGAGASGSGTLATITFKAINGGDALLHLAETDLIDSQMPINHIPHTTHDGIVRVEVGIKDMAVTGILPSKTVVGDIYTLPINVRVENQGNYGLSLNVTLNASRPLVSVVNINLYGSTTSGWGFSSETMTIPGPIIAVNKGDLVNLTLTSLDGQTHNFFVDYNGNTAYDLGEPISPDFCPPPHYVLTLNYQFIAGTLGAFTYYCQYQPSIMHGTFVVTAPPVSNIQIGKQTIFLSSGASANVTFNWATTGFARAPYDLIGYACPLTGEADLTDNTFTYSVVKVTIPGDVNGDFFVNIGDVGLITANWQKGVPPAPPNVDINGNGIINIGDVGVVTAHWQQHG